MSTQRYWVDWSDSAFPKIALYDENGWGDPLTFSEAKAEIYDHFQGQLEHARNRIAETRALRTADVLKQRNP